MANEQKLTQEQIEEIKKAAVAEALAAQSGATNGSDSGDKADGKKTKFTDNVKRAFDKFWNFSITPKKIATGVLIGGAAFLGLKYAYGKGQADAMAEAEFNGQALPDNGGEQLALGTKDPQKVFEATVDNLENNFEVTEVEEL